MKKIIKHVIVLLIRLFGFVYTYNVSLSFHRIYNILYTFWLRCFLGEVGKGTLFEKPISLQGGGYRKIRIGSYTTIRHHVVLGCWEEYGAAHYNPELIIGNNCNIGEYTHITTINKIIIGDGLLTGRFVYIGDNSHGGLSLAEANVPPAERELSSKGGIDIGRNVWIGDKVSIFGNVTIGDNVIIGAGSIVTHNIPSNSLAVGQPAKVIKQL